MRIGRLRERIKLEKPITTKNQTTGELTSTYKTIARRQAAILPIKGGEIDTSGGELVRATIEITFRYDSSMQDLAHDWQIVDMRTGRVYDIDDFEPITSATRFLTIKCVNRSK